MGITSTKKSGNKPKVKDFISWFEIPALNFQKAVAFYNQIFEIELETTEIGDYAMALFPANGGIGGAIIAGEGYMPSDTGTLVYMNGGKDLDDVLGRVETAGGRIVMDKTKISDETGYFALFIDSEGNKLGLHSKN